MVEGSVASTRAKGRPRVLIVDDEEDVRTLIAMVLDATPWAHDEAVDGIDALEHMRNADYGSVILDLMMPGKDGFMVLRDLGENRPELLSRIIILTAGTPDIIARVDQPVFDILRKPFRTGELVAAVDRCLKQAEPVS